MVACGPQHTITLLSEWESKKHLYKQKRERSTIYKNVSLALINPFSIITCLCTPNRRRRFVPLVMCPFNLASQNRSRFNDCSSVGTNFSNVLFNLPTLQYVWGRAAPVDLVVFNFCWELWIVSSQRYLLIYKANFCVPLNYFSSVLFLKF